MHALCLIVCSGNNITSYGTAIKPLIHFCRYDANAPQVLMKLEDLNIFQVILNIFFY